MKATKKTKKPTTNQLLIKLFDKVDSIDKRLSAVETEMKVFRADNEIIKADNKLIKAKIGI